MKEIAESWVFETITMVLCFYYCLFLGKLSQRFRIIYSNGWGKQQYERKKGKKMHSWSCWAWCRNTDTRTESLLILQLRAEFALYDWSLLAWWLQQKEQETKESERRNSESKLELSIITDKIENFGILFSFLLNMQIHVDITRWKSHLEKKKKEIQNEWAKRKVCEQP